MYSLVFTVPWCVLIQIIVKDYWNSIRNLRLSGSWRYIAGVAFTGFYSRRFQVDSHLAYFPLQASFLSPNNFLLLLKLRPDVDD